MLELVPGNSYQIDFIFTAKQSIELSNISITTDLFLVCPFYDHCGNLLIVLQDGWILFQGVCLGDGSSCCNCTAPDRCHTSTCTRDGCLVEPVKYLPQDMCSTVTCDPSTGRNITKPVVCKPADLCQTAQCDPLAGCLYGTVDCDGKSRNLNLTFNFIRWRSLYSWQL